MDFRHFLESNQAEETLWTIYQRVRSEFDPWLSEYQENNAEVIADIMNNPSAFIQYLDEFTSDRYDFGIREDGLIEPEQITSKNSSIIGSLPIVVYHHSTDAIEGQIRSRGLRPSTEPGIKKANPYLNSSSGVYVTTERSSNATRGYQNNAIQAHGGNARTWAIRTTIDHLQDDPDDADLGWSQGRQFVLPYVNPGDILDESNFRLGRMWMEAYEDHMDRIQQAAYGRKFAFDDWFPPGQDRIYLPFEMEEGWESEDNDISDDHVFGFLKDFKGGGKFPKSEEGYEVVDYRKGLAAPKENHKQVFKIGKLIAAAAQMDADEIEQQYKNDEISHQKMMNQLGYNRRYYDRIKDSFEMSPNRSGGKKGKTQYVVVISKNIHDIGRMSTDREWTSCMNLDTGQHRKSVYCEVKNGGFVAYLIDPEDKDIQRPKARIHIRRFDSKRKGQPSIAMPEESVYGWEVPGFLEFVQKWVDSKQPNVRPGRYRMRGGKWSDTYDRDQMVVPKERKRLWKWVNDWSKAEEGGDEQLAAKIRPYMTAAVAELLKLDERSPLEDQEAKKLYDLMKKYPAAVRTMAHGSIFTSFAKRHPNIVQVEDLQGLSTYDVERLLPTLPPETQSVIKKQVYDELMQNMSYPSPGFEGTHYSFNSGYHSEQGYYNDLLSKTHIFKPIPDPLVKKMAQLYEDLDSLPMTEKHKDTLREDEYGKGERSIQSAIAHAFYMTNTDSPSVIDFYKRHAEKTDLDFSSVLGHNSWASAIARLGPANGAQFLPYLRRQKDRLEQELASMPEDESDWNVKQTKYRLRRRVEEYNWMIDTIETGKSSQKYDPW